jgi:hydrogenase nickel incorporation protein HypA/HybF
MHELSIARAIVATAERHAEGRRVKVVNLRVGALRQVVPDSLCFYFDFVTKETVCDGARLAIEAVPARLRCRECGDEWELEQPLFRCVCGATEVEVAAGDELEVESIELGKEAAACIART